MLKSLGSEIAIFGLLSALTFCWTIVLIIL